MIAQRPSGQWGVRVYEGDGKYRWVGTYSTRAEAARAEKLAAAVGRPAPTPKIRRRRSAAHVRGDSLVYFVSAPELGLVKIGFTTDIEQRFADLFTASPVDLQLLGVIEGTMALERRLHKEFALYRVRREWFCIAGDLAAFLRRRLPTIGHLYVVSPPNEDESA